MKIETTFPPVAHHHFSARRLAPSAESGPASTSFARSRSLEMSLAEVPDVRASAVARGRALIADPNYPSPALVKKIARVLLTSGLTR